MSQVLLGTGFDESQSPKCCVLSQAMLLAQVSRTWISLFLDLSASLAKTPCGLRVKTLKSNVLEGDRATWKLRDHQGARARQGARL